MHTNFSLFKKKKRFVMREPQLGMFFSRIYGNMQTEMFLDLHYDVGKTAHSWIANMESILSKKGAAKIENAYVIPEGAIIMNIVPKTLNFDISEKESAAIIKSATFEAYSQKSDSKSFQDAILSLESIWKHESGLSKETRLKVNFIFEDAELASQFMKRLEKEFKTGPYASEGVITRLEDKKVNLEYATPDNIWAGIVALSLIWPKIRIRG